MQTSTLLVRGQWKSTLSCVAMVVIGCWFALSIPLIKADTHEWRGGPEGADSDFGRPSNWSPVEVPTVGDTALVNLDATPAPHTITLDYLGQACDSLQIWSSNESDICNFGGFGSLSLLTGPANLIVGGSLTLGQNAQILVGSGGVSVHSGKQLSLVDYSYLSSSGGLRNDGSLNIDPFATLMTSGSLENSSLLTLNGGTILGPGTVVNGFVGTFLANGLIDAPLENDGQLTLTGPLELKQNTTNFGSISIPSGKILRNNGSMVNSGMITLANSGIYGTGALSNGPMGIIKGTGGISAPITNNGGLIDSMGNALTLTQLTGNINGGELRIEQNATMNAVSSLNNSGLISLLGDNASLFGGTITNSGIISGLGRITNSIANSGTIIVNSSYAHSITPAALTLSGAGMINTSTGIIQLLDNSLLTVTQGIANNQGQIILHNATFDSGSSPLTNNGYITGTGTLRISNLQNEAGGCIGVGTGDMNVIGAVRNNGRISVQPGCKMNFFGPVSGSGAFPDSGTVAFLAGYSPGNSPASVAFGGDVILGGCLTIELGGTVPGTQSDQLVANGSINAAGSMDLQLIGGYRPTPGDRMTILRGGSLSGRFSTITGTTPGSGIELHPVYSQNSLVILAGRVGENVWILDGNGSSSEGANWTSGSAPQTIGGSAAFTSMITANRTVSVDSDLVVGTLSFDSENSYLLQGTGQIKLRANAGNAAVNVAGNHTIGTTVYLGCDTEFVVANRAAENSSLTVGAAITDINNNASGVRSLTKSGDGTLVLAAENHYSGVTKIDGGQLELVCGASIASSSEIDNDATFLVSSGNHSVPRIIGSGETHVISGTLSTPSLTQDTLAIGGNGAAHVVPEPNSIVLLMLAAFALAWRLRRSTDYRRISNCHPIPSGHPPRDRCCSA